MGKPIIGRRKLLFRILLLIIACIPLFFTQDFYWHFTAYLTGSILPYVVKGEWHFVAVNAAIFIAFLIPLSFRKKVDWSEYGVVGAFFISLFVEMYGIPLTILFASRYFYAPAASHLPVNLAEINLLGVNISADIPMLYGAMLIILGALLIVVGWITLYTKIKGGFVKDGIYAYSRHPQYLGFMIVVIGWFIGWPTILTAVFTPILIYKYIRLCKGEEAEIAKKFSGYKAYAKNTPFLV